jgi:hypothetical protein
MVVPETRPKLKLAENGERAMELTGEQSAAIRNQPDGMLEMVDPDTKREYILLSKTALERLREEVEDARHATGWDIAIRQGMALTLGDDE